MKAGLLKEVIEIWKPEITINDYGEQSTDYIFSFSCRARVKHSGGNRTVENFENVYPYQQELSVRIYQDIDDFDRVKWNNKQYRILHIEIDRDLQCKNLLIEEVNE